MPTTKAYLLTKEHVGPATEGTLTSLQGEEVCGSVDLLASGQMGSVPATGGGSSRGLLTFHRAGGVSSRDFTYLQQGRMWAARVPPEDSIMSKVKIILGFGCRQLNNVWRAVLLAWLM